jgi:hypothetical protein
MRSIAVLAAAIATTTFVSSSAFAGETHTSTGYTRPELFTVIRPGDMSKGTSAFIKLHANKAEAQAQIKGDPALAEELRARGVEINNVIGITKPFSGRLIVYIK